MDSPEVIRDILNGSDSWYDTVAHCVLDLQMQLVNLSDEDQDMVEPEDIGSSGDSSEDDDDNNNNRADLPIIKRKHHRAWTLSEVTTLVEGVSTYGVGKWSVIKRVSCSLYARRSTVDLKVAST